LHGEPARGQHPQPRSKRSPTNRLRGTDRPRDVLNGVRQHPPGGPASLAYEELETPSPGPGEALVRVHAAAITRDELDWPADRLPATPSYELSGVVAEIGAGVDDIEVGDEVFALNDFDREGAAADFTVARSEFLAPKPRTLGHVESAAIPLAGLSAWQGLHDHGKLTEGQRVLIHGAAGGVGHFAVQLARASGAYVIGTTSTANVAEVRELGAHEVVDSSSVRFEDVVGEVDLVFDTAGGERLERSPAVLRPGGCLVSVAAEPPTRDGIVSAYFVVEPNRGQLVELAALADRGELRPVIAEVFDLEDARAAFERLAEHPRGKIVLRIGAQ
jgi:NADPH:quinone reductase-like Zn-dependent oxidoreductase